jgi:hypothetical protein
MVATITSPNVDNYYIGKGVVQFLLEGTTEWRDVGNVPEFEFTPAVEKLDHFSSRTGVRTKDRSIIIEKSAVARLVMEEWTPANLALILLGSVAALKTATVGAVVGTGNGTLTIFGASPNADVGTYTVRFLTATTFEVEMPDGTTIEGTGNTDTLYVGDVVFNVDPGATPFAEDDEFPITVAAAAGAAAGSGIEVFSDNSIVGALRFTGTNDIGPRVQIDLYRVEFTPGSSINPISDEWGQLEVSGEVTAVNGRFGVTRWFAN